MSLFADVSAAPRWQFVFVSASTYALFDRSALSALSMGTVLAVASASSSLRPLLVLVPPVLRAASSSASYPTLLAAELVKTGGAVLLFSLATAAGGGGVLVPGVLHGGSCYLLDKLVDKYKFNWRQKAKL